MKLSTRLRYGTRIMLDLAVSQSSNPIPSKVIAERQGIPQSYLDNLMGSLRAAGLVRSVRGAGGGFTLTKPPAQVKISDIWRAMEGPICIIDCISQPDLCNRYEQCITRHVWKKANDAIISVLESWSLEDMKSIIR